jgi:dynein heavy chain
MRAGLWQYVEDVGRGAWSRFPDGVPWQQLLAAFSLSHASIIARSQLGPPGLNSVYDFSNLDRDVEVSAIRLQIESDSTSARAWAKQVFSAAVANGSYGGCVPDEFDRRCFLVTFERFLAALQKCSLEGAKQYTVNGNAEGGWLAGLQTLANELPDEDDLELLGVNAHVRTRLQEREVRRIVDLMIHLPSPETQQVLPGGPVPRGDNLVAVIAKIASNLKGRIPEPRAVVGNDRMRKGHSGLPDRSRSPLYIFLQFELERLDVLLQTISSSLNVLIVGASGVDLESESFETLGDALVDGRVPGLWRSVAYPSANPLLAWVSDLNNRISQFWAWDFDHIPVSFWFPGFFRPRGFLTSALQRFAQTSRIAFDTIEFAYNVEAFSGEPSEMVLGINGVTYGDAIYIYGLFMEGARWDVHSRCVEDHRPGETFCSMPTIRLGHVMRDVGAWEGSYTSNIPDMSAAVATPPTTAPPDTKRIRRISVPDRNRKSQTNITTGSDPGEVGSFLCPLYRTPLRCGAMYTASSPGVSGLMGQRTGQENSLVGGIWLPTAAPADQWILRGAALLCEVSG